jgi:hypothetical protein
VKRPNEPGPEVNSTVSEGIAYGLLIAVYMNEQEMFDEFWKYEQMWLAGSGLMDWYINAAGTQVLGGGAGLRTRRPCVHAAPHGGPLPSPSPAGAAARRAG